MVTIKRPAEIVVIDRFAPLRTRLLQLLADLSEDDWTRPTAAPRWSVKDLAAHLLGGDVGILSRKRDAFRPLGAVVENYNDLVDLINRLNAEWVLAARRMSPRLLQELLAFTGPEVEAYFSSLDPRAIGDPVSWAGPDPAPVWFDLAREFTERWHHQQQIRDATGKPSLYDPYFLSQVLDTFVRALPHNFRYAAAHDGTVVRFEISGSAGGVWFLVRIGGAWELGLSSETEPAADVVVPQDTAWRMFTKGIDRKGARALAVIRGDDALVSPIFRTVSIIG
jgi:uncharacterized protein (TIGR03083 family)